MWRSSARGCTVMPVAPASRQTRTASITDGTDPPRELRSVAILLTLTESLGMRRISRIGKSGNLAILRRRSDSQAAGPWISQFPHLWSSKLPEVLPDGIGDLVRPALNLLLILAFEHHAEQRLGSRVAHQQPPL